MGPYNLLTIDRKSQSSAMEAAVLFAARWPDKLLLQQHPSKLMKYTGKRHRQARRLVDMKKIPPEEVEALPSPQNSTGQHFGDEG